MAKRRRRLIHRHRLLRLFLGVAGTALVGLLLTISLLSATSNPLPDHRYLTADRPLIMAHRGGRVVGPENTLFTFGRAVEMGADVLEVDVRGTRDGSPVLLHDAVVESTTDGNGQVNEITLEELKKLDAGYHWQGPDGSHPFRGAGLTVATLEEALATFPEIMFNLELKTDDPDLADRVCACVREFGMQEKVLVASFHADALAHFGDSCPDVVTAATSTETAWFYLLNMVGMSSAFHPRGWALQVPRKLVDESFVTSAGNHNVAVHVWTVNDPDDMHRLLAMGVDGLITDDPLRLRQILSR